MAGLLLRGTRIERKRAKQKGDESYVSVCLAKGDRSAPVEQILGGYNFVVTLPASPADGNYTLVVAGVTFTQAASTSSPTFLIDCLMARINIGTTGCIAYGADYTARTFRIVREDAFSVSATSPSSSMTVGSAQQQGAVTKGATSITLPLGLRGSIEAGNHIVFVDADENYVPVKLSADAAVGDTSIQVEATPLAIAANSVCEYPPYFYDLTQADASRSANLGQTSTFDTGGDQDGAITGSSKGFSAQSLYNVGNAALRNCFEAFNRGGKELYIKREYKAPTGYLRGRTLQGNGLVTGLNDTAPVGNATYSPQFAFVGASQDLDEVPLPY